MSPNCCAEDNIIVTLRGVRTTTLSLVKLMYHASMARNVQITLLGFLVGMNTSLQCTLGVMKGGGGGGSNFNIKMTLFGAK